MTCAFDGIYNYIDKIYSNAKIIALENIQDPANLGAIARTAEALGVEREAVRESIKDLISRRRLVAEKTDETRLIYNKESYDDEKYVAEKLALLRRGSIQLSFSDIEAFIRKEEASNGIKYADEQKKAIFEALSGGVLLLTGGPGTGKTTVVTALIAIFESMDLKVALAAPTGRAAKRMTEATGREAKTVHRLLEVDFSKDNKLKFKHNELNPLKADVIIIDEMSMVDIVLLHSLLKAVMVGTRVIFVGDVNQLPSVGPGNVLKDLIASEEFEVVKLSKIFRQASESDIIVNAHKINAGELIQANGEAEARENQRLKEQMNEYDKGLFINFVTGSERAPIGGFDKLIDNHGFLCYNDLADTLFDK